MFGAYLKAAREKAGLSPVEAAARVGYKSADMIYKLERDAANASLEQLDLLAAAYGVLPGDLLPNSGGEVDQTFRPVRDALLGLDDEEIRDLVLMLASQARLVRNAVSRRVSENVSVAPASYAKTASTQITGEPRRAFGLAAADEESPQGPLSERRHRDQTPASPKRRRTE